MMDPDPFYVELGQHADRRWRPMDSRNRDRVRELADGGCQRCAALVEEFDRAFMAAFFGGTGPWA